MLYGHNITDRTRSFPFYTLLYFYTFLFGNYYVLIDTLN